MFSKMYKIQHDSLFKNIYKNQYCSMFRQMYKINIVHCLERCNNTVVKCLAKCTKSTKIQHDSLSIKNVQKSTLFTV